LQPVQLAEQQRVTLFLSESENGMDATEAEMDQEVGYQPLPLQQLDAFKGLHGLRAKQPVRIENHAHGFHEAPVYREFCPVD
jgi:hypothetical protein